MSSMTLFELRAYLAWVNRGRDKFLEDNPKPKKGSIARVELDWYNSQINSVNNWIQVREAKQVRDKLNAEAKQFLNPEARSIVQVQPRGFALIGYKIKQFGKDFWAVFTN